MTEGPSELWQASAFRRSAWLRGRRLDCLKTKKSPSRVQNTLSAHTVGETQARERHRAEIRPRDPGRGLSVRAAGSRRTNCRRGGVRVSGAGGPAHVCPLGCANANSRLHGNPSR